MSSLRETVERKPIVGWLLFLGTMFLVFLLGLLASSIIERRGEAMFAYSPKADIQKFEPRNAKWGEFFPREYQSYMKTADTTFRSKYRGGAVIDELHESPFLVMLWAGYAFSKDYKQGRGHYYAVTDVYNTLRTGGPLTAEEGPQPTTCWTCKSPDVPRMMEQEGLPNFYKGKWARLGHEVVNSIGCADCHDPENMNLRITRPSLVEAFQKMGKDITKASHQEMRSLVCAQCHVEYYFDKKSVEGATMLVFPWEKGTSVDSMEAYYNQYAFSDWTHNLSKAPMLKAQHPDYELFLEGIHAQRGVSCADCHMPYRSEGGVKYTDHHIQSPLNNINTSCQVCHRESEETLRNSVYERQIKVKTELDKLGHLLVKAHVEAKAAHENQVAEKDINTPLQNIRSAQWNWDFVAASHGGSFHAPIECLRIISNGIHKVQEARIQLSKFLAAKGITGDIALPDYSTKEKAQEFIGLDMNALRKEKKVFLETVVPEWLKKAQERESQWK